MQWDAILRDSLRPAAPYVVWLGIALATSVLVAIIREPLCRVLREARDQLRALRTRLLARSTISLGRRLYRFWLARQYEPARSVAGSLDRLADTLPYVGRKSIRRLITVERELQKQLGILKRLGLQPVSLEPSLPQQPPASTPRGSWWKLLMLVAIAGLTGGANSFLLNEFFQGVITSDALFPHTLPDLQVSHVFAILIFTMEIAIGYALHHFAEQQEDGSAARKLLATAPWLVLVGLLWLEGWAYALLSYQIDIPDRLGLPATSGLYSFARYFLALFGAGLTLLLASLGYLLGKEIEQLQAGSAARRQERYFGNGWGFHHRAEQIERTERVFARLKTALTGFNTDLVYQFRRAVDATSGSNELTNAIHDALTQILDAPRQVDGESGRPVRTQSQALAEMSLLTAAFAGLVAVGLTSSHYVAAFVREMQGERQSAELLAGLTGLVLTGFGLSTGYVAAAASGNGRYGSTARLVLPGTSGRRALRGLAVILLVLGSAAFILLALANRPLGPAVALNLSFGAVHAGILFLLGAVADAAMVNTFHALELVGLYLERWIVSLAGLVLWLLRVVLAVMEWAVRVVSVFGQLVVRPRPPVQVGVAEVTRGASRELRSPARRFADRAYPRANRGEHA
jgi:hypothetical protein